MKSVRGRDGEDLSISWKISKRKPWSRSWNRISHGVKYYPDTGIFPLCFGYKRFIFELLFQYHFASTCLPCCAFETCLKPLNTCVQFLLPPRGTSACSAGASMSISSSSTFKITEFMFKLSHCLRCTEVETNSNVSFVSAPLRLRSSLDESLLRFSSWIKHRSASELIFM